MDNNELLAHVNQTKEAKQSSLLGWVVLGVSVALFAGAGWFKWSLTSTLVLIVVVLIHELGHVLAMKMFGYRNVRILFIPLLGGLASGAPREHNGFKNCCVALAGPIAGLLSCFVVALAFHGHDSPFIKQYLMMALFINLLNLLPIMPLDGGQVVNEILFSRFPKIEVLFRLLGVGLLGFWAYADSQILIGIFALFQLMGAQFHYQISKLATQLKETSADELTELNEESVAIIRERVEQQFPFLENDKTNKQLPTFVKNVWMKLGCVYPSLAESLTIAAVYVAAMFTLPIAFFVMLFLLTGGSPGDALLER